MKVRHDIVIIVVDEEGDTVVMKGLLWMSPVKTFILNIAWNYRYHKANKIPTYFNNDIFAIQILITLQEQYGQ